MLGSAPSSELQALLNPYNGAACGRKSPLLRGSEVKNSELWLQIASASAVCGELALPSLERDLTFGGGSVFKFAGLDRCLWSYARCVDLPSGRRNDWVRFTELVFASARWAVVHWPFHTVFSSSVQPIVPSKLGGHLVKMTGMAYLCQMCRLSGFTFMLLRTY